MTWRVGEENCAGGANVYAVEHERGHVVAWTSRVVDGGKVVVSDEQAKKHAHLIAAAPELLAALEAAREELRLLREKDSAGPYDPTLRGRIDAAIAKARGGSHIAKACIASGDGRASTFMEDDE